MNRYRLGEAENKRPSRDTVKKEPTSISAIFAIVSIITNANMRVYQVNTLAIASTIIARTVIDIDLAISAGEAPPALADKVARPCPVPPRHTNALVQTQLFRIISNYLELFRLKKN